MTRPRIFVLLAFFSLVFAWRGAAQQQPEWVIKPLTAEGWVEFDYRRGIATATNGVLVRYGDAFLTADKASVNQETGEVAAEGQVRILRDDMVWNGERMIYNFKTRQVQAEIFRAGKPPVFTAGEGLHGDLSNRVYVATNSFITTDDVSRPAVKVKARSLTIIPGDKVIAHDATLCIGDVPVFYFPYYSRKLDPRSNHFEFLPGYRSLFGPFLLSSYHWYLGNEFDGELHVDYRVKRGIGTGPDINYHLGRWGEGTFRYYYLHDEDPNADSKGGDIPTNRQRVYFSYLAEPYTNFSVRSMVRWQGDTNIVREFFEREYREDNQPSTYVNANKFWQNFSLDALVQPRVNNFLETVERLPDVRLTGFPQPIGETPIYYQTESSVGYYERLFAETNSAPTGTDYAAARADTYHQLILPQTFFGWLNVTPRVGGRFTYYSQASGPGAAWEEQSRGVFNTGAEVSFKASRLWPEFKSSTFDMDGLRHIVAPSANYVYVPEPNVTPNQLPQFDYVLPSLRLLPMTFPEFNAIDSVDSQNTMRWGLHNKLQTKRRGEVVNVVNWDLYADWHITRNSGQNTFSDVFSDAVLRPWSWCTLESLLRYDVEDNHWNMSYNTLTLHPNNVWSWSIGHYYLHDNYQPIATAWGPGNNVINSAIYYRLNEDWGFRASHYFNARTGEMQEQAYTVYRDLRTWTVALTFRLRDNQSGPEDLTVAFTFSLKALPKFGPTGDMVKPSLLWGG
jgi:lipopolysaccharide assembly outer membrane protein LptD (OstA)